MDENTKKMLHDYLQKILESAEKGADFVMEQAPEVAKEIVAYGRATSTIPVVACAVVFIAGVVACRMLWKRLPAGERSIDDMRPIALFALVPSLLSVVVAVHYIDDLSKVWFAPRLYLIEYIRTLLR